MLSTIRFLNFCKRKKETHRHIWNNVTDQNPAVGQLLNLAQTRGPHCQVFVTLNVDLRAPLCLF